MKKVIEGSHAVSEAVRLARVEVIAAYPITPQTHIVEALSEYCSNGSLNARFINVESEHSAMAECSLSTLMKRAFKDPLEQYSDNASTIWVWGVMG